MQADATASGENAQKGNGTAVFLYNRKIRFFMLQKNLNGIVFKKHDRRVLLREENID